MNLFGKIHETTLDIGSIILTNTISCAKMKMKFVFVFIRKMDKEFSSRMCPGDKYEESYIPG